MVNRIILIPLLHLISFVLIAFFGRALKKNSALIAVSASVASCALALTVIWEIIKGTRFSFLATWLVINKIPLEVGISVDPLAAMMLFVVTLIGTLIIIYSTGYMDHDPRFPKFFSFLSLFMFSMLGLVLSPTLAQIYIFWELVGLCSYFLIGFWFEKKSAAEAGRKAFITNRIGDIGFFLGIATFFYATGTMRFADMTPALVAAHNNSGILLIASLLLFCGAVGKSAQFPLHVWLPDAMEGPTPVSALIHAATMVAAGVYLVARLFPIFDAIENASKVVAMIGTLTAFMAAFFALTQMDIKKVLAYSTISQLGYMIAAIGLGGLTAGTFHLMTHAFFKALLFLGAGSVIHGSGVQDMKEMGGLRKYMPVTFWTFLIATIAIAGIPPFSGFWSKDEILTSALESGHMIKFWLLAFTAAMTSFYMFRLLFLTFFGENRAHHFAKEHGGHGHSGHPHESPWTMTVPLMILAVGSIVIGFPGSPFMHHWFQSFILSHAEEIHMNPFVVTVSITTSTLGFLVAFICYIVRTDIPEKMAKNYWLIYAASKNKLWIDEIYQSTVIQGFKTLANQAFRLDQSVIDRTVNEVGWKTVWMSKIKNWFDVHIVDGLVNFTGWITERTSALLRHIQTGYIHQYLFFMILGLLIIAYSIR